MTVWKRFIAPKTRRLATSAEKPEPRSLRIPLSGSWKPVQTFLSSPNRLTHKSYEWVAALGPGFVPEVPLAACPVRQSLSPLPHRSQNLKVTLLGTGAPRPTMERFGPSILVEAGKEKLLFDCGRGATQRLFQLKVPFGDVTSLFLTHLHSDHIVGIPDLYLTGWIMRQRYTSSGLGTGGHGRHDVASAAGLPVRYPYPAGRR